MVSQEVLRKIKEIEIIARRLVSSKTIGAASSAQKGTGFEFDQLREYQPGDDVRSIDWNSSARTQKLLVKQYIEERNRTIYIVLDVSPSMVFASTEKQKNELAHQIAALIALIGNYGKDKVGLILFGQIVELHRPARTGRAHTWQLIHDIFTIRALGKETNIDMALHVLNQVKNKNIIVFLISDFIQAGFEQSLKIAAFKHEVVAIRVVDHHELELPDVGVFYAIDMEGGTKTVIDSRLKKVNTLLKDRIGDQDHALKKSNARVVSVSPSPHALHHVAKFFTHIMKY